jgi:hypothetical protein
MRINPAIKKEEEREEEEGYQQIPRIPQYPGMVPKSWVHIPDDIALDEILADGKPKVVTTLLGWHVFQGRMVPISPRKVMRKDKSGYSVWEYSHLNDEWAKHHFKNMQDMATHPRSSIGMSLFYGPKSNLYYIPGSIPEGLKVNPARNMILRQRKLNAHYGIVTLVRVFNNERGNYAVWGDDSNTICDTTSKHYKLYGFPARYDLKHYPHYAQALNDYLTRKELRHPVPLRGG